MNNQPHRTLSDVALQLNATLELDKLLKYAVNAASVMADSQGAVIFLPSDANNNLHLRAFYSLHTDAESVPELSLSLQDSLPGKVFKSAKPLLISQAESPLNFLPDGYVKSTLYLPMVSRKQVIGVLAIFDNERVLNFNTYDLKLMQQLASHAAVAIENARIYAESQARSFELALIIDAAEAVNATLSLPQILSLIGKNLMKALQADWCEVLSFDIPNQEIISLSAQRRINREAQALYSFGWDELPHLENIMKGGEPRYIETEADGLSAAERLMLNAAPAALCIPIQPLQSDDSKENKESKGGGRALLHILLSQAEDVSLSDENLKKLRDTAEYALTINGAEAYRGLLQVLRHLLRDTLALGYNAWREDETGYRLIQMFDESSLVWSADNYPQRHIDEAPTLYQALHSQSIFNLERHDEPIAPDLHKLMLENGLNLLLGVPFQMQGRDLGLVLIGHTARKTKFERREINLAQALVLQAANALKNARLFEDLQLSLEELRDTQARLVQSARLSAIGELATAVAHQINNPLTTILGDAEILLDDIRPDDPHMEGLKAIQRAGRRSHEVVQRLLTMARQQSGPVEPNLININATIRNTLMLVEGTLYRAGVTLHVELDDHLPLAAGISGQLEDVWLNLILNARDALRGIPDPQVWLRSRYDAERCIVEVTIQDNGPGFGEYTAARLFSAFFTTKPAGEGTGLGLYICSTIVEKCHGTITAQGLENSQGALFTVSLPCAIEK